MHFVLKIEKVETFVMVVAFRKAGWGRKKFKDAEVKKFKPSRHGFSWPAGCPWA